MVGWGFSSLKSLTTWKLLTFLDGLLIGSLKEVQEEQAFHDGVPRAIIIVLTFFYARVLCVCVCVLSSCTPLLTCTTAFPFLSFLGGGGFHQVPDAGVDAKEVGGLVSEADAYSLASHLLWAMWALLQSKVRARESMGHMCHPRPFVPSTRLTHRGDHTKICYSIYLSVCRFCRVNIRLLKLVLGMHACARDILFFSERQ